MEQPHFSHLRSLYETRFAFKNHCRYHFRKSGVKIQALVFSERMGYSILRQCSGGGAASPPFFKPAKYHFYVQKMLMCYCSTHSHHRMRPVSCKQRSVFPNYTTTFKVPSNSNNFMILRPASAAQQNPGNIF